MTYVQILAYARKDIIAEQNLLREAQNKAIEDRDNMQRQDKSLIDYRKK